jgi:hypothetical protein
MNRFVEGAFFLTIVGFVVGMNAHLQMSSKPRLTK